MSAKIIPLHSDRYLALRYEVPPQEAFEINFDYELATLVLQFAQAMRNEVFQCGKPLSIAKREALLDMRYMIEDLKL